MTEGTRLAGAERYLAHSSTYSCHAVPRCGSGCLALIRECCPWKLKVAVNRALHPLDAQHGVRSDPHLSYLSDSGPRRLVSSPPASSRDDLSRR
jgi:hypothetical protein